MKKLKPYGRTSSEVASKAGRKLRDPNSTADEKSISAAALVLHRWAKAKR